MKYKGALAIGLLTVTIAVYFAGALAQKTCTFPFCQGYTGVLVGEADREPVAIEGTVKQGEPDTIATSLYEVIRQTYSLTGRTSSKRRWGMTVGGRDGGIDHIGNNVLVASKEGELYHLDKDFNIRALSLSIPVSSEAFEADVQQTKYMDATPERNPITEEWFGVKDILVVRASSDSLRLFASYNAWDSEEQCHTLKVSQILLASPIPDEIRNEAAWRTVYETKPCLELKNVSHPFGGLQSGGRMAQYADREILVSVGDFEFDGIGLRDLPQDPSASYGKTVVVNFDTGQTRHFTVGHRNPQGLYIDEQGQIWSTEHGPRGGDELNLLRENENYGWPEVTYGTCYGHETSYFEDCKRFTWPFSEVVSTHRGYTRPMWAWVPSVGISQLIRVQGDRFEAWRGDLLAASLSQRRLYRIRVKQGRVVLIEPVYIGERIRDLVQRQDGMIVLKSDSGTLHVLSPAS